MRRAIVPLLLICLAIGASAQETTGPIGKAKIRFVGIFIHEFSVWKISNASCDHQTAAPELLFRLECGLARCPKPALLDMPAPPSYLNWQKSPRVREVEVDAGVPLAFKLTGNLPIANGRRITVWHCDFNARFVPEAGKMYEASVDSSSLKPERARCQMSLTVMSNTYGWWEKKPFEESRVNDCTQEITPENL